MLSQILEEGLVYEAGGQLGEPDINRGMEKGDLSEARKRGAGTEYRVYPTTTSSHYRTFYTRADAEKHVKEIEDEYPNAGISEMPMKEDGDDFVAAYLVEALNGKVSTFLEVFTSILVQYDQAMAADPRRRGYNPAALSHYLGAIDRIKQRVKDVLNDDSKEAAQKLLDAIDTGFTDGNPGDKLRKVVRAYIEKGTLPKVPISKAVKAQIAAEKAAAKAAKAAGKPVASQPALAAEENVRISELTEGLKSGDEIVNKDHPEWGTFRVTGKAKGVDGAWEIRGDRGSKVVYDSDASEWKAAAKESLSEASYAKIGDAYFVDTAFINAIGKSLPGFELRHLGMGEFELAGPGGRIDFDRMRGKDFPGQSGRSHKLYDDQGGKLIKKLLDAMKDRAKEAQVESALGGEPLEELGGGGRRSYGGDPRWMEAKYAGTAKDGTAFRKGDKVLYFPATKSFYVGAQAEKEWRDFLSAKGDEEGVPYAESKETTVNLSEAIESGLNEAQADELAMKVAKASGFMGTKYTVKVVGNRISIYIPEAKYGEADFGGAEVDFKTTVTGTDDNVALSGFDEKYRSVKDAARAIASYVVAWRDDMD